MDPAQPISKLRWLGRALGTCLLFLIGGWVLVIMFWPDRIHSHDPAYSFNIGWIGKALIISEIDHGGELPPEALTDAYALAAYLARTGAFESAGTWFSMRDPVWRGNPLLPATILEPVPDKLHAPISPEFQGSPLAWAVALVPSATKLPPETPLIWTRGLRPDGTWREDSAERGEVGVILFVGENVSEYPGRIDGKLRKFNTGEPTSNILEALPPGTRISEFTPPSEVASYAHELVQQERRMQSNSEREKSLRLLELLAVVLICSAVVTYPRRIRILRWAGIITGALGAFLFWGVQLH